MIGQYGIQKNIYTSVTSTLSPVSSLSHDKEYLLRTNNLITSSVNGQSFHDNRDTLSETVTIIENSTQKKYS